jgi:hypothetical protein
MFIVPAVVTVFSSARSGMKAVVAHAAPSGANRSRWRRCYKHGGPNGPWPGKAAIEPHGHGSLAARVAGKDESKLRALQTLRAVQAPDGRLRPKAKQTLQRTAKLRFSPCVAQWPAPAELLRHKRPPEDFEGSQKPEQPHGRHHPRAGVVVLSVILAHAGASWSAPAVPLGIWVLRSRSSTGMVLESTPVKGAS